MVFRIFLFMSGFGVLILLGLAILSCISIFGRSLTGIGLGPVPGDFELVEAGTAFAVFCFLPLCHIAGGHASVELFYNRFSPGLRKAVIVVCDVFMLLLWIVITWRTGIQAFDYKSNGELTFILQFNVWVPVMACAFAGGLGCTGYLLKLLETMGWVGPMMDVSEQAMVEKH
jgi:TRAP-type C4-dicarboxylate transport system permease small subunit